MTNIIAIKIPTGESMQDPDDVTVYRMGPGCDLGDVEEGKVYIGRVQGFANFGTFIQLNDRVKGLVP